MERGEFRARDASKYKKQAEKYEAFITNFFDGDVTIQHDTYFQQNEAKKYALDFHNLYIHRMLRYVKLLANGHISYLEFRHKLSILEAIFPVISICDKRKRGNFLFILDREDMHEILSEPPLSESLMRANYCFINATTIVGEDGNVVRLNNPSPEENIDLFSSNHTISHCIQQMPADVRSLAINLLGKCLDVAESDFFSDDPSTELTVIVQKLKTKYSIA